MTGGVPIWMVPTKPLGQLSKWLAKLQTVENTCIAVMGSQADRWKMATEISRLESNLTLHRAIVKSERNDYHNSIVRLIRSHFYSLPDRFSRSAMATSVAVTNIDNCAAPSFDTSGAAFGRIFARWLRRT